MKSFLQGAWLGHPLHGLLVHLPMGLWPAALLFDGLSFLGLGNPVTARLAYYAMLTGLVVALTAVVTGVADWWDIKPGKPARRLGLIHLALNLAVWVLFALNAAWRWSAPALQSAVAVTPLLLSLVATAVLVVSAYLGGRMVYAYGVSVARISKDRYRRLAQAGGARVAEK
jgi:uncharacterized membrane protein